MNEERIKRLEAASDELRHLARLIYVGQLVERVGLLYSFNEQSLCQFLSANKKVLQKRKIFFRTPV